MNKFSSIITGIVSILLIPLLIALPASPVRARDAGLFQKYGGQDALYDFDVPELSKAPSGYKPSFIEHYGRHGARYAYDAHFYTDLMDALNAAAASGLLTERGETLYRDFSSRFDGYMLHVGELTRTGWSQQQEIGRTMVASFPTVFKGRTAYASAVSSASARSIMSMAGFCSGLQGSAPDLEVNALQGSSTLEATNPRDKSNPYYVPREDIEFPFKESCDAFCARKLDWRTILGRIFTEVDSVIPAARGPRFTRCLYVLAIGMNSLAEEERTDFSGLFTEEDLITLFECQNYRAAEEWWCYEPRIVSVLLDMVGDADKRLAEGRGGVTARFGHDHVALPLFRLMGLGRYSGEPTTADKLEDIFNVVDSPMCCNVQMVFYTHRKAGKPVLVKFLLNGREERLCIPAAEGLYYDWDDVQDLFRSRIARFPVKGDGKVSVGDFSTPSGDFSTPSGDSSNACRLTFQQGGKFFACASDCRANAYSVRCMKIN